MPYTPPSQQSPATSRFPSPPHSRSSSYLDFASAASPPRSPGPNAHLPRSSSQSYFHKPRRAPSHLSNGTPSPQQLPSDSLERPGLSINTNVRQSPPPQSDSIMPPGAMISPPDSVQNSSDEDETPKPQTDADIAELEDAVRRSINISRDASPPEGTPNSAQPSKPAAPFSFRPVSMGVAELSPDARKISHSRSSSETMLHLRAESLPDSCAASDNSEDDDDQNMREKPLLIRKKSGELVKPAIRPRSQKKPRSMPGTPTFAKAVHFNDNLAQVRHFLHADKPIAVSAGTSPVESLDDHEEYPFGYDQEGKAQDFEVRLPNFPRESMERLTLPARLESLSLSHDQKSLVGHIAVANLAFQKHVAARFTFDYWKTTSEVVAEYSNDPRHNPRTDGYDGFAFSIKLSDQSNVGHKTLLLCVRYNVNGQEYWDNNTDTNFQVDFAKRAKPAAAAAGVGGSMPPRSRRSTMRRNDRPGSLPASLEDDFSSTFDGDKAIQFRHGINSTKPVLPDTPPARRSAQTSNQFSNRYDFGASLTAALSQAQAQLGERSGIKPRRPPAPKAANPPAAPTSAPAVTADAPVSRPSAAALASTEPANAKGTDSPKHEVLLANKQSVDSRAYQDFISKFCFFGSKASPSPRPSPSVSNPASKGLDGTNEADGFFGSGPGPEIAAGNDEYANQQFLKLQGLSGLMSSPQQVLSPTDSRSASPRPQTGRNLLDPESMDMSFPFPNDARKGFWNGAVTPPAIKS